MRAAMEIVLSTESKQMRKVLRSTATVEEMDSGSGLDVDKKQDLQVAMDRNSIMASYSSRRPFTR
jgi:hypothetical protein